MSASKPSVGGVFGALIGLTGFSALAGVLVAVMVTPAIAVTSVTATSTIGIFDTLPESTTIGAAPQQNQIYAIDGYNDDGTPKYKRIASVYSQNRQEIGWDVVEANPILKNAVLAAEDHRFYEHGGIDPQGIVRAAITNLASGGIAEGASTLTQQYIKNVCITEAVTAYDGTDEESETKRNDAIFACQETSFDRKLREMKYAIGLEKEYTKDEILLGYLNIAGFGGNIYGIQSAAEVFYDTDARDLTVAQAASLVGIVQEPSARRLDIPENYESNKQRRDLIINNMFSYGYIDQAQRDEALATPVDDTTVTLKTPKNGCIAANQYARQFCDYVVHSVKDLESLGSTAEEREKAWRVGGYKLYTTLDLSLNETAQKTIREYAPIKETRLELGSSAVSIEPGTGKILVMAQNKVFDNTDAAKDRPGTTALNFNTDYDYGGSNGFQPGSQYKLFTLLNWLQSGHGLNEVVKVDPVKYNQSDFADSCQGPWGGAWSPRNDSGERGYRTIRAATAGSINGAFAQMALQLDQCETGQIAERLGVHSAMAREDDAGTPWDESDIYDVPTNPANILGTNDVAPMTMAAAFAGVANGGVYCKPIAVTEIENAKGEKLPGQKEECSEAIDSEVAAAAISAMQTGAAGYAGNPRDGTPIFGKTGTTDSSKQTWISLATTGVATTVWYGNIRGDFPIRSYSYGTFGGNQRHVIMNSIMSAANKTYKGGDFEAISDRLANGVNVKVGDYFGQEESAAKSAIESLKLKFENVGEVASSAPAGTVGRQDPEPGQPLSLGQTVRIWISDGTKGVVPETTGQNYDAAVGALNAAGFSNVTQTCTVGATQNGQIDPATGQLVNPTLPAENQVTASKPSAGTTLMRDKTVTLTVVRSAC